MPVGLCVIRTAESVVFTDWPPGPGRAVDVDLEVVRVDLDVDLLGLREHRHRRRGGVDAALGLGLGHALDAVRAALELEHRVGAVAADLERVGALAGVERLGLEPAPLGVAGEHAVEVAGPQARLVAARALADLDDHVALVVGVALDHREADLLLELLQARARGRQHLPQLGVVAVLGQQLLGPGRVVRGPAPLRRQLGRRLERAELAPDLGVAGAVGDHRRVRHLRLHVGEARLDLRDERLDHTVESRTAGAPATASDVAASGYATTSMPTLSTSVAWRGSSCGQHGLHRGDRRRRAGRGRARAW